MSFSEKLLATFPDLEAQWDNDIIPVLKDYIRIPCKSIAFDSEWKQHGYIDQAAHLLLEWCQRQSIPGMQVELLEIAGRTPLLLIDIPGQSDDVVLLYGHLDKQPEMTGWDEGLAPWQPVLKENKLYGRGGADDGYALFSSISAIQSLQRNHVPHSRCVVIIEASEESGSGDLPAYIEQIKTKIGHPSLVICLDAEAGNYEQLWCSTSIRGIINGTLKIEALTSGIHSGAISGTAPSAFMILRRLLSRIENSKTGEILLKDFYVDIPPQRIEQAKMIAETLGHAYYKDFPFAHDTQPLSTDINELVLNRLWRPYLSVIGMNGLPNIEDAGNVAVPKLEVKLSFRIPPTCDAQQAAATLKRIFEKNPPFMAKINFHPQDLANGWDAPLTQPWLEQALQAASQKFYHKPMCYYGTGGTIPFMGMLGKMFPKAQFFITGVVGPKSNAHGPNEFLHVPYVKKLTACVASVIAAHYETK